MGDFLDIDKNLIIGRSTDVDKVDIATSASRSTNELMLEGINPAGICLHADIRYMAVVGNVMVRD